MKLSPSAAAVDFGERRFPAFTIVELLVVVVIIGLMAAVGLPALKGFGKSNAINAADRQMLDDIAYARQRALADHTDVYMLFMVPTNSTLVAYVKAKDNLNLNIAYPELLQVSNLLAQQYSSYAFYVRRTVGDQPGQANGRYLTGWRSLPSGIFIRTNKFNFNTTSATPSNELVSPFQTNSFPFPTATNASTVVLPYLQFNHLGQLVNPQDAGGEVIPLARGSILYLDNPDNTHFNADFMEAPPGNSSTNSTMYNRVRIDGLTGRARIEQYQLQ